MAGMRLRNNVGLDEVDSKSARVKCYLRFNFWVVAYLYSVEPTRPTVDFRV